MSRQTKRKRSPTATDSLESKDPLKEPQRKKRKLSPSPKAISSKQTKSEQKDEEKEAEEQVVTVTDSVSRKEIDRLKSRHRELLADGYKCIVGVDEAGRGPLAGPVVVSAAYVPIDVYIDGVTDSKKINDEKEREKLYDLIVNNKSIKYSIAVLDHNVIDEYNILEASMMGMRECVQKLHDLLTKEDTENKENIENIKDALPNKIGVEYVLVDGNRNPRFEYPAKVKWQEIVKGDANVYCIATASIIAKVTRDRLMIEYDKKYPIYQFAQNKGYPTPFHKQLVLSKGPCDIHRKSFKPVKDWYEKHEPHIFRQMEKLKKQRAEERKQKHKTGKTGGNVKKQNAQKAITQFFGSSGKKKRTK